MNRANSSGSIPLPAHWPRHVRTAMLHVVSLAHAALTYSRGWAANSPIQRVRLAAELSDAQQELALLREELRIKDSRMARLPAHRRPFYGPTDRMAILELRAARGWSATQTARSFLVEPDTVADWTKRSEEEGDRPLLQLPEPANKYPEFARQVVQRLKTLCPLMGKKRIAHTLARAGLHLASTTVKRMLDVGALPPTRSPATGESADESQTEPHGHVVTARYPNHVWHVDLTVVPTRAGFWTAWFPFCLLQVWPFCWPVPPKQWADRGEGGWVAVVVDHFSRTALGFAVFRKQPTSEEVRAFLGRAMSRCKAKPRHLISDRGPQFDCDGFRAWAKRKKVRLRYGAVGKYGSIAVVERFIRSLKSECLGLVPIPLRLSDMRAELASYIAWFNEARPHQGLAGRTPAETARQGKILLRPRYETRGTNGVKLRLVVSPFQDRHHLPLVALEQVA